MVISDLPISTMKTGNKVNEIEVKVVYLDIYRILPFTLMKINLYPKTVRYTNVSHRSELL